MNGEISCGILTECTKIVQRAGIAQSVWRLATGWTVRGSIPGDG